MVTRSKVLPERGGINDDPLDGGTGYVTADSEDDEIDGDEIDGDEMDDDEIDGDEMDDGIDI